MYGNAVMYVNSKAQYVGQKYIKKATNLRKVTSNAKNEKKNNRDKGNVGR